MKKTLILLSILTSFVASAQSIEINPNGGTNASAILDLKSTTKGFLLPRMTNAQMRAIPSPAQGLLAFCTDCGTNGDYYFYKGTDWVALGSTTVSVSTTMGSVSANADEKGATITTGGVLNLAPANATNPGIITATDQTFGGVKTFSNGIVGNVTGNVTGNLTGNAATVTTNANLTGVVTSTGNVTAIADRAITNAMLANGAVSNLSGTNTGDQINITGNSATVTTNANLTGDVTSIGNAATVVKINGTSLSGLPTGILKNTTATGVPTIATAGTDYQLPITLTTTGSGAATLSSNILNIPNVSYTLPTATSSTLGGVKIDGTSITMNPEGVVSVTPASIGAQVAGSYLTSSTGVTSFNGSTTGLTPASATSGAVTLGGVLVGANGGTGVNNTGKTITLGGNLTTSGAFTTALTTTANTAVTLPVTGTLATLAGTETLTNKTLTSPVLTTPNLGTPSALVGTNITGTATALNIGGNAATVTTNANLTGVVTSNGNVTSIANDAITNAMIANNAVSRLSGTNTGDQTTITGNAGTATKIASISNADIVQLTSTQTLTNKTLTSPTITGTGAIAGTFTGDLTGNVNGNATTATTATTATNVSGTVAIAKGGTGATTASDALTNLGAAPLASPTFTGTLKAANQTLSGTLGVGTSSPNTSAKVEVDATNKGVLLPRVTLTGSTDATTIATPATSLLVYNTATVSDVVPGYYYNSGTSGSPVWIRLNTSSTGVTTFNGSTTGLTPSSATSDAITLGGILVGANGGTGVANTGKTITLGGNLTTSGAFNTELTTTANTAVTLPITGTLATLDGTETLANKTLTSPLLTGNPQAPTAPTGTITTQIATTEFVKANSVDLTTAQTIAGSKTFSSDLTVNGLTVGKGANGVDLNTAFGYNALVLNNQTGLENTAVGYNALASNTLGDWNTANGTSALKSNTTGQSNTSIGDESLLINTTGTNNTAIGVWALYSNIAGSQNTAIGSTALKLSKGNNNTAIGFLAGHTLTTGINNIIIGYTALSSTATVNNEITLGDESITALRCKVTSITSLSDRRDKTNIIPIGEGLAFLKKLNPVSFTWNTRDKAKVGIKSAGFIAQELLALQKQSNIGDNLDLVSENNPEILEARYGNLLPVVVKAIQEESAEKDKAIQELKERIYALEKLMNELLNKK